MNLDRLIELMTNDDCEEFLQFKRIKKPMHRRPDLCAFLMMDRLVPNDTDMVCAAEHDEIWLQVEPGRLAAAATESQVIDLIRCGVRYSEESESFCMFV